MVARAQEIGVQRMHRALFDGLAGCRERLTEYLATEDSLRADIEALTAKKIQIELFKGQQTNQILDE